MKSEDVVQKDAGTTNEIHKTPKSPLNGARVNAGLLCLSWQFGKSSGSTLKKWYYPDLTLCFFWL